MSRTSDKTDPSPAAQDQAAAEAAQQQVQEAAEQVPPVDFPPTHGTFERADVRRGAYSAEDAVAMRFDGWTEVT